MSNVIVSDDQVVQLQEMILSIRRAHAPLTEGERGDLLMALNQLLALRELARMLLDAVTPVLDAADRSIAATYGTSYHSPVEPYVDAARAALQALRAALAEAPDGRD